MTSDSKSTPDSQDVEQPLIAHLAEIRTRLIRSLMCVLFIFLLLSPFYSQIYTSIATPLISKLPEGTNMIATEVASPFFVPFKLTGFMAIFISMPYLLYQLWSFVSPGLYKNEKHFDMPLLVSSIFLFLYAPKSTTWGRYRSLSNRYSSNSEKNSALPTGCRAIARS